LRRIVSNVNILISLLIFLHVNGSVTSTVLENKNIIIVYRCTEGLVNKPVRWVRDDYDKETGKFTRLYAVRCGKA